MPLLLTPEKIECNLPNFSTSTKSNKYYDFLSSAIKVSFNSDIFLVKRLFNTKINRGETNSLRVCLF